MATSRVVTVSVNLGEGANINYGFRTTVDNAASTILGHTAVTPSTAVTNLIFGSSRPKPGRASRFRAGNYQSSFYSNTSAVITAARNAGFSLSRPRGYATARSSGRSVLRYIRLNGINYGWNFTNRSNLVFATNLTALGIRTPNSNDLIVLGANFPKPPRAAKRDPETNQLRITYYDPDANLPVGITKVTEGLFTQSAIPR